jgi:hypothetical protein
MRPGDGPGITTVVPAIVDAEAEADAGTEPGDPGAPDAVTPEPGLPAVARRRACGWLSMRGVRIAKFGCA